MFLHDEWNLQRSNNNNECEFTDEEQQAMEQAYLDYARTVELYRELIRTEMDHERILMLKSLLMAYQEDNK
jgi:hypothetical protein